MRIQGLTIQRSKIFSK